MDAKSERGETQEAPPVYREIDTDKSFSIIVPKKAGVFEQPGKWDKYFGTLEKCLSLKETESGAKIGWNEGDVRRVGPFNWYYFTFTQVIRRNGDKDEITRFGYFGTKRRTAKQRTAGEPLQFIVAERGRFVPGPPPKKEPVGEQYEFVVRERPKPILATKKRGKA